MMTSCLSVTGWIGRGPRACCWLYLNLPEEERPLTHPLDCVRLRRHADRRRVEIGLVTDEYSIETAGAGVGIPTFQERRRRPYQPPGLVARSPSSGAGGLPTVGGNPLALRPDTFPTLDQPTVLVPR
jgi:hypothetical protein